MLPSVSAGSAALTKYAQAVAIAAPEEAPRDSDAAPRTEQEAVRQNADRTPVQTPQQDTLARDARADRKSTRLNSSHDQISYAVFCLKKKTTPHYLK